MEEAGPEGEGVPAKDGGPLSTEEVKRLTNSGKSAGRRSRTMLASSLICEDGPGIDSDPGAVLTRARGVLPMRAPESGAEPTDEAGVAGMADPGVERTDKEGVAKRLEERVRSEASIGMGDKRLEGVPSMLT